jgi:beta-glucosidase
MDESAIKAKEMLEEMTPEERFNFVSSYAPGTPDDDITIMPVERLGIPRIHLMDASGGLRIFGTILPQKMEKSTAFPCPLLLSATWNKELAYDYAHAVGEECRAVGIQFLLGPGVNIYRSSRCGRNFEYMGEDPYLTSTMTTDYIKGMQSTGVAATVKHFLCNNDEYNRRSCNPIVDERTINEIYLPAFKAAVDAGTWGAMTAYNQFNGEWCGQSEEVVTKLLRDKLGFEWLCMTDWTATWDGEKVANSGTDIEKPYGLGLQRSKEQLLGSPQIDRMVFNIMRTCLEAGLYDKDFEDPSYFDTFAQHEELAKRVNDEGIVLLKNNGILPLSIRKKGVKILVSGNCATRRELSGGGSAHVQGYNLTTYFDALSDLFGADAVSYVQEPTSDEIANADMVFLFNGFSEDYETEFYEGENRNRPFELPDNDLIEKCTSANENTVVCIVSGGGVSMDCMEGAAAIVHTLFGGQTGPASLVDILTGAVNPSGKLPFTIEYKFEDSPAYSEKEREPNRDKPYYGMPDIKRDSFCWDSIDGPCYSYDLNYTEGIFVGYRWYDSKKIKPRYAFGHGLSYTEFIYDNLAVEQKDDKVYVYFQIKNAGNKEGMETAQVYVHDAESTLPRPEKELKGFAKVNLMPGETKNVKIQLDAGAFSYWSTEKGDWWLEAGEFDILVGASSADIRLIKNIII